MNILTTDKLQIGYPVRGAEKANAVLSSLDLRLPEGSLTLLIGANGSGKSTLLRTLSGAQAPLSGSVSVMGKQLSDISIKDRARMLALVYTDRTGGGGLTVKELVSLGRQPYTGFLGRLSRHDRQRVDTAMEAVGIAHKSDSYAAALSDGERQKAMIARALAQETPAIILDEPTAFLDIASRLEIMQLLSSIVRENNKTILLSTHDLASALNVADRLWVVDADKASIIEGSATELISDGVMDKVFPDRAVKFDARLNDFTIA